MSRFINLKEFSHNLVKDIFSIKKMDNKDNREVKREMGNRVNSVKRTQTVPLFNYSYIISHFLLGVF